MTTSDLWLILAVCGFVVGLNPGIISVFTGLLATGFGKGYRRAGVASIALVFIESLMIYYICLMTLVVVVLDNISQSSLEYFGLWVGLCLVGCGIFNIALAYYQDTNSEHKRHLSSKLHNHTVKQATITSTINSALTIATINPTTTLAPLIGVSVILALSNNTTIGSVAILPIATLAPLVLITILALKKIKLSAIMKWKNNNASTFHTWSGSVTIMLGWLIWLLVSKSLQIIS